MRAPDHRRAPSFPAGEERLPSAVRTAFLCARERATPGQAAEDNRAAVLALGMLLGHTEIERLVGHVMSDQDWQDAQVLKGFTLRGRRDWTRHFLVSAALTAASAAAPSDAAGVFKEELDADGGSGFSFGDLAADRAGTRFGVVAVRDETSALALQQRVLHRFEVGDYFPPASDLPEDIEDAELQSKYGGVGGPLYRRFADEIERRLALCPAYRDPAFAPAEP